MFAKSLLRVQLRRRTRPVLMLAACLLAVPAVAAEVDEIMPRTTLVAAAQAEGVGQRTAPNALLTIDQHRSTVVERIVSEWAPELAAGSAGITAEELRTTLSAMRADDLLAASMAGSLEGLRKVVVSAQRSGAPASAKGSGKALGDAADDLVYTPVVPCRIVDIVGYFATPLATALQCAQVASGATAIAVSADTLVTLPSCATGYTRTGSSCSGTSGVPGGYLLETNATGCLFRNLSSVTTYNGTATSTCCRVPGR